jgi:hypothetical protein
MLYEHSTFVGCGSEEGTVVRPAKGGSIASVSYVSIMTGQRQQGHGSEDRERGDLLRDM